MYFVARLGLLHLISSARVSTLSLREGTLHPQDEHECFEWFTRIFSSIRVKVRHELVDSISAK